MYKVAYPYCIFIVLYIHIYKYRHIHSSICKALNMLNYAHTCNISTCMYSNTQIFGNKYKYTNVYVCIGKFIYMHICIYTFFICMYMQNIDKRWTYRFFPANEQMIWISYLKALKYKNKPELISNSKITFYFYFRRVKIYFQMLFIDFNYLFIP